jgi:hypothetical protein
MSCRKCKLRMCNTEDDCNLTVCWIGCDICYARVCRQCSGAAEFHTSHTDQPWYCSKTCTKVVSLLFAIFSHQIIILFYLVGCRGHQFCETKLKNPIYSHYLCGWRSLIYSTPLICICICITTLKSVSSHLFAHVCIGFVSVYVCIHKMNKQSMQ